MASPAFGTQASAGESTAADVTINVPASTVDNDFLLAVISKDATDAITPPGGWNALVDDTANTFHLWIGWRIASSEPSSYSWTFASTWRSAYMQRYTGVVTSAPLDPAAPAATTDVASNTTATTASNNIATAATLVVAVHTSKTLSAWLTASATVDSVTMTARTTLAGGVEVHTMDGAKAAAATPEAGKAQGFSGPAGAAKAYMLVLASLAPSGGTAPPGLGPALQMQPPQTMPIGW